MNKIIAIILLMLSLCQEAHAQRRAEFYQPSLQVPKSGIGYRVGVNNSFPVVVAPLLKPGLPVTYRDGIGTRYGFYLGAYYYKDLSISPVTFRLDATLQMKSIGADYNGAHVITANYYSVGVTPLIGLHLTNRLSLYTGPEANLQFYKDHAWGKGYPLEVGTTIRVAYSFGRLGAEAGYFRSFTKSDRYEALNAPIAPIITDFFNQNVQVGILFKVD